MYRFCQWVLVLVFIVLGVVSTNVTVHSAQDSLQTSLDRTVRLYKAGEYSQAVFFATRTRELIAKRFGEKHENYATILNLLAILYQAQGRYSDAEPLFRQSLAIREQMLGRQHPDVAVSLNNLAALYQAQGRYSDADLLHKRALAIRTREQKNVYLQQYLSGAVSSMAQLGVQESQYQELPRQRIQEMSKKSALKPGLSDKFSASGVKKQKNSTILASPKFKHIVSSDSLINPPPRLAKQNVPSIQPPKRAKHNMTLPDFPWPPPEPSVQMRLPLEPFKRSMDLKNVSSKLTSSLRQAGYWEYSFYRIPNGFALVTRLERMNEDGSPATESVRYRLPGDRETFSLGTYIKRLFFASTGYYRLIVFIVTDLPFTASGDPINEREALKILRDGANVLPSGYKQMKFSDAYGVDALIYEFKKGSSDRQVSLLLPGRLSPVAHFKKAGLSVAFGLQPN